MKEFVEKLIQELKEESIIVDDDAGHRAVEIIEQLAEEYNNGWIPCSVRMPEHLQKVHVTCHSLCDNRKDWVATTIYFNGEWGIPMVDNRLAEVIAWKKYTEPKPYKPKNEDKK